VGGIGQGRIGPIEMPVKFKPLHEVEKTIKKQQGLSFTL
jgi:hypothetical protein